MLVPPLRAALVLTVAAAVLLAVVFSQGLKRSAVGYASYVLSAWMLVSWIVRAVWAFPTERVSALLHRNQRVARIVDDSHHRMGLTTAASSALEFVWVATNAVSAVRTGSAWFATLAAYYGALAVMRLMLAPFILKGPDAPVGRRELSLCRLCGVVLALCAPVFAGMVVLVTHRDGSFSYSEYMVYLVALYAFYSAIGGVVRFVKGMRGSRPAVRVANAVSLVAGAVSMLSLAVAMIDMFGSGEDEFRVTMVCSIGGVVCLLSLVLGVWIVARAKRWKRS